jgi:hypothetical protein
MMANALDKLGTRMTYVRMPSYNLNEKRVDPATGEEKLITTLELVQEQLQAADGMPDFLFLPQQQADNKAEVGSVPLFDNIGSLFLEAISYTDQESTKHILPFFLISDQQHGGGKDQNAKERRMEAYYNMLDAHRRVLTSVIIKKVLVPLVEWNFNREAAKIPPTFNRVYSDRPEDRVATMQMVKGLTETGYLNAKNTCDWDMVRQMLWLSDRKMSEEDITFVEDMLIKPRQKPQGSDDQSGPQGSGKKGRPTGNTMPNKVARLPAKPVAI